MIDRDLLQLLVETAKAVAVAQIPEQAPAAVLAAVRTSLQANGAALLRAEQDRLIPVAGDGLDVSERALSEAELAPGRGYPLLHGGAVEGVLLVDGVDHDRLAAEEATLAPLLDLAAVALRNVRLSEQHAQALAEVKALLAQTNVLAEQAARPRGELAAILEQLPCGVLVLDSTGRVALMNEAARWACVVPLDSGRPLDEQVTEYQLTDPAMGRPVMSASGLIDCIWSEGTAGPLEYTIRPAGQTEDTWIQVSGALLRNADGLTTGMVGVFWDVTRERQMIRDLTASEERFRTLFETMTQGVIYQDASGQITSANPAAEEILGLSLAQLQGRTSPRWKVIREDGSDFPSEGHPAMVALRTGEPVHDVIMGVFNSSDAAYRWISVDAIPQFRPGEDQPYQVYATFDDITERRCAEESLSRQERHFRALIENSADAIRLVDCHGTILYASPSTTRVLGYAVEEFVGRNIFDLIHPDDRRRMVAVMTELLTEPGRTLTVQYRVRHRDNSWRWTESTLNNLLEEASVGAIVVNYRDVTDRKLAEMALKQREEERSRLLASEQAARAEAEAAHRRAAFLAEASAYLASSLDYEATLADVARLAVPSLADWCTVDVLEPDGTVQRLVAVHRDPAQARLLEVIHSRFPAEPASPRGTARVLATGRSILVERVDDAHLVQMTCDAAHRQLLDRLGVTSYVCAPLVARGKTLGMLTLGSADAERRYGPDDLTLVEDLARRVGQAMDNSRLFEAELLARRAAEQAADRTARLQAVTAALARALTPGEVTTAVIEQATAALGALAGVVALVTDDGAELEATSAIGYSTEMLVTLGRFSLDAALPLAEACRTSQSIWLESETDRATRYPELASSWPAVQGQAWAAVPLLLDDRPLGALGLSFAEARSFSDEERTFLLVLARQCAQSLERAMLFAAEARARAEAGAMAGLTESLAASVDASETLQVAVDAVPRLLGATAAGIYLPGPDEILRCQAVAGHSQEAVWQYQFRPGEGYVGRAFRDAQLQRVADVAGDPASHQPDLDTVVGARAFLATPLVAQGRVLGVITAAGQRPGMFTSHHADLLLTIAQHVATALAAAKARAEAHREATLKTAILEQMTDAVLVADSGGRIVLSNPAASRLFGVPLERLLGMALADQPWGLFDDEGREIPALDRPLGRALRDEMTPDEYRVIATDGQERWYLGAPTPLRGEDGQIEGAVLVARDVTDERQRQQQAVESEKLSALGQMAAGIAHDFNNALAPVVGFSELLLTRPEILDDRAQVRDFAWAINKAGQDASEVVARLRQFYRRRDDAEAFAPVDLNEVIAEVVTLTRPRWKDQAQARGTTIRTQLNLQPIPPIHGRAADLREALTNLVCNAVDAMPNGGTITLATRAAGQQVELEVGDTGLGMPEEVRRRCLEPFFTTKGEGGTGLGLPMVHGIVRRHTGTLEITSAPGQGTVFRLRFPISGGSASPENAARPAVPSSRRLRVLVVEDDPRVRELLAKLLAGDGHGVDLADNGRDGLAKFVESETGSDGARRFDLVITDRAMPEMNGDEFASAVKQRAPAVPVITLTGFGELMRAGGEHPAGVDHLLGKPVPIATLRQVISELLPADDRAPADPMLNDSRGC